MQRCYGSFLFLAQINSRPSKVIGCLDCEADFDLKNPKSKMTDSSYSPSCLYLSSVVAFVLPRLAPQWQPSWLWSLVNIKLLQREADLPQELIDSQKVSMKDSEVDVDNIAMKRNWSENVRWETVSDLDGDWQFALLAPLHAVRGLLLDCRLVLLLPQTNGDKSIIGSLDG